MRWLIGGFITINVLVFVIQLMMRTTAEAPEEARAHQPAPAVASAPPLKLLSELDESTLAVMRRPGQGEAAGEPQPVSNLCTLVGPFSRLLRAEYFAERLTALELKAQVRELEIPGDPSYWVYMPSQGSRKQAFDTLRGLQAKGIDSYVIPGGELENGISFGMFSQHDLAKKRLAAMREEGYQVKLKEVTRSFQEVWVVLEPGQAGRLSQQTWQKMMLEEDDELERRQNYCPVVASK